ncbi:MAG: cytochrome c [Leptospiraceae bacterium]|nr:cytochrome c [Leptospiraceae bacterium]
MSNTTNKSTPNPVLFLFFGFLAVGLLSGVYSSFFLQQSPQTAYLNAAGTYYEKGVSTAITFESWPERSPANIAAGEKHYQTYCAACHAANLTGGIGPNLVDNEWLHFAKPTEENIAIQIIKGVGPGQAKVAQGAVMPPKGGSPLSNTEIQKIVYFITSKNAAVIKTGN